MPTVPTYDAFRAMPTQGPNAMVSGPSGQGAGEISARQAEGLGNSMLGAGTVASRIATSMQDQVDAVRVNDAVNQARKVAQDLAYNPQTGYLNLKGDAALSRPDGKSLDQEYGEKLREQLSNIAQTLGNDNQRRHFQLNANDLANHFNGQVEQHLLGEFRNHALSVQDGTISLAADDAKLHWNDPDMILRSIGAARAAVYQKGQVSGWSATQTDAALLATTSKVHGDVILSALANQNPMYAQTYLEAHRGEMSADDILKVQGHVNTQIWQGLAQSAVQKATADSMPQVAPTGFDRMVSITAQTESGGRETNPDGSTVTSPAGAKGVMQVMPGTNTNPGFGVKPAADNSPEERARVGRDYLQAMLQRYGNPAMAWAAYNAGPGRLDQAISEAQKDAGSGAWHGGVPSDLWLQHMPAETQAYVAKNMKALQSGGGVQTPPTELDFVNRAVAALPPGSPPTVVQMTREHAIQQFGVIQKSMNETADAAIAQAQRFLANNPGATVDQIPPSIIDPVKQYAPGKVDDLVKYSKTLERGDAVTDLVLYNRLAGHTDELAKMSDPQFESLRAHLSPSDFKHFANERQQALNGTVDTGAGAINNNAMNAALTSRLQGLGINPNPPGKDRDGQERVGGIKQFVRDSIFSAQQQLGRKMTPDEVEKHIDGLFTTSVQFRNSLWGTTSTEPLMEIQFKDLPSGAAEGLKQALVKSGNLNPTNNDVLNLYRKLHTRAPS